jgi:HK97 family phage prohead protease
VELHFVNIENFKQVAADKGLAGAECGVRKQYTCDVVEDKALGERTLRFVISTGAVDRMNDTVSPEGWNLKNYKKNPVVLWAHDYRTPPIGRGKRVGVNEKGQLVSDVEFVPKDVSPFADMVFQLCKQGFVKSASVGFRPTEFKWAESEDRKGGMDFTKQELLEWSIVPVPANPEALSLGIKGIDTKPLIEWSMAALKGLDLDENPEIRAQVAELAGFLKGAIPFSKHPLAPKDQKWDGPKEVSGASVQDLQVMCTWRADKPAGELLKGDFKLPHHTQSDKHTVWRGVANAAARLPNTQVPDSDKGGIKAHLGKHYKEFGEDVPWGKSAWAEYEKACAEGDEDRARVLCADLFDSEIALSVFPFEIKAQVEGDDPLFNFIPDWLSRLFKRLESIESSVKEIAGGLVEKPTPELSEEDVMNIARAVHDEIQYKRFGRLPANF